MAGRPTSYRPEYCDAIKDLMRTGLSITAAAASIGFPRQTLYEWEKAYPAFAAAIALARGLRVLRLETELLDTCLAGPQITARIFALKNAAPDEWREKVETVIKMSPLDEASADELDKLREELVAERTRRARTGTGSETGRTSH